MKGGGLPRVVGGNTHTFHPCERTLLVLPIWPIYPINSLPLGGVVGLSTPGNFAIYSAQMISSPLEGNVSMKICQIFQTDPFICIFLSSSVLNNPYSKHCVSYLGLFAFGVKKEGYESSKALMCNQIHYLQSIFPLDSVIYDRSKHMGIIHAS